jgi:hypothetical protein
MKWYRFYKRYHSCLFRPVGVVIIFAGYDDTGLQAAKAKHEAAQRNTNPAINIAT